MISGQGQARSLSLLSVQTQASTAASARHAESRWLPRRLFSAASTLYFCRILGPRILVGTPIGIQGFVDADWLSSARLSFEDRHVPTLPLAHF